MAYIYINILQGLYEEVTDKGVVTKGKLFIFFNEKPPNIPV